MASGVLDKISVSVEKFNGVTLLLAVCGLIISLMAFFKDGTPPIFKGKNSVVWSADRFLLTQSFGNFIIHMPISIRNDGGSDIGLKEMSFAIQQENGQSIVLKGETWAPNGVPSTYSDSQGQSRANFSLSDIVIKPGASWAGSVQFAENLTREKKEQVDDFNVGLFRAAKRLTLQKSKALAALVERLGNPKTIGSLSQSIDPSLFTSCEPAPLEIAQLGRDMAEKGIARLTKGSHTAVLLVEGVDGLLHKKERTLTIFERDIGQLKDIDNLTPQICSNQYGGSTIPRTTVFETQFNKPK